MIYIVHDSDRMKWERVIMLFANHSDTYYAVHTSATGTRLYYNINKLQYYYIIYTFVRVRISACGAS